MMSLSEVPDFEPAPDPADMSAALSYDEVAAEVWRPIDPAGGLVELVRAGVLAANSHNTQAWRFVLADRRISILPDFSRRCPAADPDDHHLYASLGCAAENILHAAAAAGLAASIGFDPVNDGEITIAFEAAPVIADPLVAAITGRRCTRALFNSHNVPPAHLRLLETAGSVADASCVIVTDRQKIEAVVDFVNSGNAEQLSNEAFMDELYSWLRFNDAHAVETRDGLSARSSGNLALPQWLGRRIAPLFITESGENEKATMFIRSSAGIAIFSTASRNKAHWVEAGRAYQRFALEATRLGIKHSFINQPVDVPALRSQFASHFDLGGRSPDLIVRFGYGHDLPHALRRPLDQVIERLRS